jgi:hypothetical protein
MGERQGRAGTIGAGPASAPTVGTPRGPKTRRRGLMEAAGLGLAAKGRPWRAFMGLRAEIKDSNGFWWLGSSGYDGFGRKARLHGLTREGPECVPYPSIQRARNRLPAQTGP